MNKFFSYLYITIRLPKAKLLNQIFILLYYSILYSVIVVVWNTLW